MPAEPVAYGVLVDTGPLSVPELLANSAELAAWLITDPAAADAFAMWHNRRTVEFGQDKETVTAADIQHMAGHMFDQLAAMLPDPDRPPAPDPNLS